MLIARPCNDFVVLRRVRNCLRIIINNCLSGTSSGAASSFTASCVDWRQRDNGERIVNAVNHMHWPLCRVRTILALGYWVLRNIFQYWVLGNTFIGCHTQYQYCLDTLIPVASRWQQGNWRGGKVKLVSWQIKELKMKFNKQWY